jgi:hypothetical protein
MLLAGAYWLGHLAEVVVQGVDRIGRVRLYGTETSDRARDLVFFEFDRPAAPRRPRWGIGTVRSETPVYLHCRGRMTPM